MALEDARTKLARAETLSRQQLLPQSELDAAAVAVRSAEAQVRSAEAQVAQARAVVRQSDVNLENTVITAPIDGIVLSRSVDVGQTVAASMQAPTLFVLAADLTRMQVLASLDESDIGRIANGQRVTFTVDAHPRSDLRRHRLADSSAAPDRPERRDVFGPDRRSEPRADAEAGHDRQRDDRG